MVPTIPVAMIDAHVGIGVTANNRESLYFAHRHVHDHTLTAVKWVHVVVIVTHYVLVMRFELPYRRLVPWLASRWRYPCRRSEQIYDV